MSFIVSILQSYYLCEKKYQILLCSRSNDNLDTDTILYFNHSVRVFVISQKKILKQ